MFSVAQLLQPAPTDVPDLARFRGAPVVELSGEVSSGKSTLALQLCLAALREGQAAAWIDSGQGFHPFGAVEAGEPLDRLLVVRVRTGVDMLRAADMILSCPGAVTVAVAALPTRYSPPESALLRLQRLAERSGTTLLLLDERPPGSASLGSAVGLRLHVRRAVAGEGADWSLHLEVTRSKSGPCGPLAEELRHGPNRLCLRGTL